MAAQDGADEAPSQQAGAPSAASAPGLSMPPMSAVQSAMLQNSDGQSGSAPQVISHMNTDEDISHEKAIWDQYRAWKRHIPRLYEHLTVHPLEWPTLTLDWLPEDDNRDEEGYTKNYLLLGTQAFEPPSQEELEQQAAQQTSWEPKAQGRAQKKKEALGNNFMYNLRCYLPSVPEVGFNLVDQFYRHAGKVELQQRIPHEAGVVNRIRHMPQNPHLVATKGPARSGSSGSQAPVFVYYLDVAPDLQHQAQRRRGGTGMGSDSCDDCPPLLYLFGHTQEGMALSWNKRKRGIIASGGDDQRVLIWDIDARTDASALPAFEKEVSKRGGRRAAKDAGVTPIMELKSRTGGSGDQTAHDDAVQDVDFHASHEHLLFSVGDDKTMRIWDTRVYERGFVQLVRPAHNSNINCVQAHPFADHVVATCGSDSLIKIWDIRFMKRGRHNQIEPNMTLRGHSDEVTCMEWAPQSETILATGSRDRTVIIWDIEKHGQKHFDKGRIECCGGWFNRLIPQEWRAPEYPVQDHDDLAIPPDIMFIHFGHTAPVTDISWNPNEDWMMASASEDNFLHLWQMSEKVRLAEDFDDDEAAARAAPQAVPMEAVSAAQLQGTKVSYPMQPGDGAAAVEMQPMGHPAAGAAGAAAAGPPGAGAAPAAGAEWQDGLQGQQGAPPDRDGTGGTGVLAPVSRPFVPGQGAGGAPVARRESAEAAPGGESPPTGGAPPAAEGGDGRPVAAGDVLGGH